MNQDIPLPFDLPAVARKKVSAAFNGGRITSDGGVMLLAQAERRLGIADQLAAVIPDVEVSIPESTPSCPPPGHLKSASWVDCRRGRTW
jgi:hypothetical protein